jgi:uncharacterized membrane protein
MDIVGILKESVEVSKKNYVIFAPPLAAMVIMFLLRLLLIGAGMGIAVGRGGGSHAMAPAHGAMMGAGLLIGIVGMVLSLFAHGATVAMAREAIDTGTTSLDKGTNVATARFVPLLVGAIVVAVVVIIGTMFLVIPGLIVALLLMFTFVLIVVENLDAVEAMKRSFAIVKANLGDSIVFFVALIVLGVVFGIARTILSVIPFLGQLAGMVLFGLYEGYISIGLLKVYRELTAAK